MWSICHERPARAGWVVAVSDPDRLADDAVAVWKGRLEAARSEANNITRTGRYIDLGRDGVPALIAEVDRLRDLLTRLEWAVVDPLHGRCCPACDGVQPDHDPGCELAAMLRPDPKQAP